MNKPPAVGLQWQISGQFGFGPDIRSLAGEPPPQARPQSRRRLREQPLHGDHAPHSADQQSRDNFTQRKRAAQPPLVR
jgi:hypothetical protein